MKNTLKILLTAVCLAMGCDTFTATAQIYVTIQPQRQVVVRTSPPRPEYVWVDEDWEWRNGQYVWVGGRWVEPRVGYRYRPGRWRHSDRGHIWQAGRWESGPRGHSGRKHDHKHGHGRGHKHNK